MGKRYRKYDEFYCVFLMTDGKQLLIAFSLYHVSKCFHGEDCYQQYKNTNIKMLININLFNKKIQE